MSMGVPIDDLLRLQANLAGAWPQVFERLTASVKGTNSPVIGPVRTR